MRKQVTASILSAVVAASTVMAGCGSDSAATTAAAAEAATKAEATEAAETKAEEETAAEEETKEAEETKAEDAESGDESGKRFPTDIGLEKIGNGETLTIAIQPDSHIEDYDNNWLTNHLEESLGINIEFYMMPSSTADFQSKMSLLATGGDDLPDIIMPLGSLSQSMILDYGSKGLFVPLEDYLNDEEISPHFNAIPEEDKQEMLNLMTAADGHVYGLIKYEPQTWNYNPYRLYINQAWLDKLGLEVPTTTDELKEVLTQFVNNDPNGNGRKDEIGVYGIIGGYGQNTAVALMNAFTFYDDGLGKNNGLALSEDGTVYAPWVTDEWRKGLEYLKDLYDNGLLAPAMFSDNDSQFTATLNLEDNVIGFCSIGSQTVNYPDADNNKNYQEMTMIEPLTGPEGVQYTPYAPIGYTPEFFVTSACENPELAFRVGEAFYDYEMSLNNRYGEYGVDWTDDPEVCAEANNGYKELGLIDEIKLVTNIGDVNVWGEVNNKFWHNIGPRYTPASLTDAMADGSTEFNADSKSSMASATCYELYNDKHPEQLLPVLSYTQEESTENAQVLTSMSDLIDNSMAEFITGTRNLDDDGWNQYLKEMENVGLNDWIENAQAAYDRIK